MSLSCFLLSIFIFHGLYAQVSTTAGIPPFEECGTIAAPNSWERDKYYGSNQSIVNDLKKIGVNLPEDYLDQLESGEYHSTNLNTASQINLQYIPIKAWIYRRNDGSGNISEAFLRTSLQLVNDIFSNQTNIRFYLLCDVEQINNTNIAENGETHFNTYTNNNRLGGVINMHFVIDAPWGGKAKFPWDNPNYACAINTGSGSMGRTMAHEIGHVLGLYHTHESARSSDHYNEDAGDCYQESVSRTRTQGIGCVSTIGRRKCEVNGDQLCDTPADPGLFKDNRVPASYVGNNCIYQSNLGGTDNWGDQWQPSTSNVMSYSTSTCFENFSALQFGKMSGYIPEIGISPVSFNIVGNGQLCIGQSSTYTVNALPGVNTYTWEVPSGYTIISGQGTNSVVVQKNVSAGGTIRVRPNFGAFEAAFEIKNMSGVSIQGPTIVCPNIGYSYEVPYYDNATYSWTVTNGTIIDGQNTRFPYIIFNGYNSSSLHVNISIAGCSTSVQSTIGVMRYSQSHCGSLMESSIDSLMVENDLFKLDSTSYQNDQKLNIGQLNLYPNTASTYTNIAFPDDNSYDLIVYDFIGEVVCKEENVRGQYRLDVSNFKSGLHLVNLLGNGKVYQQKLLIKR